MPPGRGSARAKFFGSALLQPAPSVCISPSAFSYVNVDSPKRFEYCEDDTSSLGELFTGALLSNTDVMREIRGVDHGVGES